MKKPNLSLALLEELTNEAENTRKLFAAVPDSVLDYKPNDFNWSMAGLASHIANIYHWWVPILNQDVLELSEHSFDIGDISNMKNITEKFEENLSIAQSLLESYPEEKLFETWRMTMNGKDAFPPSKRIGVARSMVLSHLYHHRGELVAYLRANHLKVPGLYGPSYEEMPKL